MNEREIFTEALHLSADGRKVFLASACGDNRGLHDRVDALLHEHDRLGSFLDRPAAALGATGSFDPTIGSETASGDPREAPGTAIGPYKLLQQIGEGGMGTVFMAEQTKPVQRKVALKVIKAGMDSRPVIARFEAERQALAMMDHVNIARVFDAGATEAGRPYFVMELVHGVPITNYCDDNHLTPRERLELFVPVCQAIQHAHQKGIIHRDIKPSNVMITLYDGRPVPKVIDFGVAKATESKLTGRTLFTQYGTMVGTLEYMSPEQAEMSGLGVDTRSDIYSLGVLLYELLTGNTPLSHKTMKEAAYAEILRMIKEDEPPKPSTRLSDSGEALASISAHRHMEPAKLTKLVRGELDWIVMKPLEKDRNRRYETAKDFAADVQRYLADEPVQACPPKAWYRFRKFTRRHKGPVLAATLVLLALVVGFVGTSLGLVEAWRQGGLTEQARQNETDQRLAAVISANNAKAAREEAEKLARKETAAREETEKQLFRAEWLLYASQINLAQQAWHDKNVPLAFHYLHLCRPDFRGWEYDYLFTLFNGGHPALRGHTGEVSSVALSADGKRIVSGSADGTVKIWDAATGQNIRTLKTNQINVNTCLVLSVALSADGKRIASGNWDMLQEAITVWNADTGKKTVAIKGISGVNSVALSPDAKHVAGSSFDGSVRIWDANTGAAIRTLRGAGASRQPNVQGQSEAVSGLAFSPDGKHVVGCEPLGTITIWDSATGKEIRTLKGHTGETCSIAISADGKRIVSGGMDKAVKIWDFATGQELRSLTGHTQSVASVALSSDGRRIVTGSYDETLKIWDAATGQDVRTFKSHTGAVHSVAISPDGKRVVSGGADMKVRIWDTDAAPKLSTFQGHTQKVSCVSVTADGKRIVTGSHDKTVKFWDAHTGQKVRTLGGQSPIAGAAVSHDGKRIVGYSFDQTLTVWDADTGQQLPALKAWTAPLLRKGLQLPEIITGVALSADGNRVIVDARGKVTIWDTDTGREIHTLKGTKGIVRLITLSVDGQRIVSGSLDDHLTVWDADTGREIGTLKGHAGATALALSADGKRVAGTSGKNTIKVWDSATGEETCTLTGHTGDVVWAAFSPDGKRVFSASLDPANHFWDTVKVWDAATGYETLTLRGIAVDCLAVSVDGKRLLGGSFDGTVKVWDASVSEQKP